MLVLDEARWHRVRDLRIAENMCLVPRPPYSPQLNPVEHLGKEIREKWFPNLVFDSQRVSRTAWWRPWGPQKATLAKPPNHVIKFAS